MTWPAEPFRNSLLLFIRNPLRACSSRSSGEVPACAPRQDGCPHGRRKGAEAEAERRRGQARQFDAQRPQGRPRMYGDDHYRRVAEVYMAAWLRGDNPTQAVERQFYTSHSTAARWVRECRKPQRGLLRPRGGQGGRCPAARRVKEDSS